MPSVLLGSKRLPLGIVVMCAAMLVACIVYFILLSISVGEYNQKCVLTSMGMVAVIVGGACVPFRGRMVRYRPVMIGVLVLLGVQSVLVWRVPTIRLLPWAAGAEIYFIGNMAAVTIVAAMICVALAARQWRRTVMVVLIAAAVLQFAVNAWLFLYRDPDIDVWFVHHDAISALAEGKNPYAITFDNIYNKNGLNNSQYYSQEVQKDGKLMFGYPYPPLSLLLIYPSEMLTQDSRYGLTAFYLAGAVLIAMLDCGGLAICAGALLLLAPSGWLMFREAWTEPQMIFALAWIAWCGVRKSPWLPVALGLFFAMKQYSIIVIPLLPLIWPRPLVAGSSLKFLSLLIGSAAVVTLPLALWDWSAFWHSTVYIHTIQPFRYDAFSYLAMYARSLPAGHAPPSSAVAYFVLIPFEAFLLWKLPRNVAGFTLGVGVAMMMFMFFNRQAFLNYHALAAAALLVSVATFERLYSVPAGAAEESLKVEPSA